MLLQAHNQLRRQTQLRTEARKAHLPLVLAELLIGGLELLLQGRGLFLGRSIGFRVRVEGSIFRV